MSASPVARQAVAQAQPQCIPRRVTINSPADLPNDYSTTPGGTLFSTTPGGTRIIYERNFLLQIRNSPLARTPPKNLPVIPGVTAKDTVVVHRENGTIPEESEKTGRGHGSSRKNKKGALIQIRLPKDNCPRTNSNKNASQGGFTLGADTFIPTKDNCIPLSAGFSYSFVGGKEHRKVGSYLIPLRSGSIVTNVVVYVFLIQEEHVDQKYIATRLLCKAEKNLGRVISSKWTFKIPVFLAPASPGLCPS